MLNSNNVYPTTGGTASQLCASAILLAATQCLMSETLYQDVKDQETYDFIIIGGGSAGSVLANRLSEIKEWKILLLEAGYHPPIESDVPRMDYSLFNTKYDWQYYTQNDGVRHQAYKNGSVYWPRGKMLGGCSSINGMIYIRGRDYDFQSWADAGNPSWTPENVNCYFRKAESFQNMKLLADPNIRDTYGLVGPQIVNNFNTTIPDITEKILESYEKMGFKRVTDFNAANYEGLGQSGILSSTAANGLRYSTYRSYLDPIKNRKNLEIVTNAFVTKILIDSKNQAYGVEVDILGKRKILYANLEVILSAGAINTPQLLMLSGIGPKEHLISKNITCIMDLPGVGQNLHDHNAIFIPIYGDELEEQNQGSQLFEIIKYIYARSGILAENSISNISAFFSRNNSMKYPEFQIHFIHYQKNSESISQFFSRFHDVIHNSVTDLNKKKALYLFVFLLLHPFSRGSISLKTSNPYDYPIINANYFGDDRDLQATADGIKMFTKIMKTQYFKSINAFVHRMEIPQCNQYEFESELYWKCFAMSTCGTVYHPVGTAKMGPNPKDSVVDNFLKVHGVKRLRVIDASVMPSITSGNTNAPTIMIGEMGADMIKDDYLDPY